VRSALALLTAAALAGGCASSSDVSEAEIALGVRDAAPTPSVTVDARVLSTEPWTFDGREGLIIRTPHYRVFTTESDEVLRDRMVYFLEYAMAHYRTAAAPLPAPTRKLDTYLMDTRPQWVLLTQRLMGSASARLVQIQRGGYASRGFGVYYDLGLYDTLALAAHEGWHQYTQRTFRNPLPIWLEEGMAVYMEGHRWRGQTPQFLPWANTERFDRLRELLGEDGRFTALPDLLTMKPTDHLGNAGPGLLDYYAQVWSLTHFLMEGEGGAYRRDVDRLLRDAAAGQLRDELVSAFGGSAGNRALALRVGPEVFQAYFTDDLEAAAREYEAFCRSIARTGARERIVTGTSPVRMDAR
jgi:hypothetical protein